MEKCCLIVGGIVDDDICFKNDIKLNDSTDNLGFDIFLE